MSSPPNIAVVLAPLQTGSSMATYLLGVIMVQVLITNLRKQIPYSKRSFRQLYIYLREQSRDPVSMKTLAASVWLVLNDVTWLFFSSLLALSPFYVQVDRDGEPAVHQSHPRLLYHSAIWES